MHNSGTRSALTALMLGVCAVIVLDALLNLLVYTGFKYVPFSSSESGQEYLKNLRQARVHRTELRHKPSVEAIVDTQAVASAATAAEVLVHKDALLPGDWVPSTYIRHTTRSSLLSTHLPVATPGDSDPLKITSRALFASLDQHFPRYSRNSSALPSWILTPGDKSHIHRFFDTMPLSPSGRYMALTRAPNVFLSAAAPPAAAASNIRKRHAKDPSGKTRNARAEVAILDLTLGTYNVVATTAAWGAQLGAQVQWGNKDTVLFYNVEVPASDGDVGAKEAAASETTKFMQPQVTGTIYNPKTNTRRMLQCPVYHVSPDGLYTVAPDMSKIRHTQLGYGADYIAGPDGGTDTEDYATYGPNSTAPGTDGVFVNDIAANSCTLVISLQSLAKLAGIGSDVPVYGFHTKWSPDGQLILVVIRSLEPRPGIWSYVSGIRVRRQHLFVVQKDGSEPLHLKSWSSSPFRGSGMMGFANDAFDRDDGNHPNWAPAPVPRSSSASSSSTSSSSDGPVSSPNSFSTHRFITMNIRSKQQPVKLSEAAEGGGEDGEDGGKRGWNVVQFDVDEIYHQKNAQQAGVPVESGASSPPTVAAAALPAPAPASVSPVILSKRGTGHPLLLPGRRYLLMDAYAKEMELFDPEALNKAFPGASPEVLRSSAPLRLVDTHTDKEVWLLRMQLQPHGTLHSPGLSSTRSSDNSATVLHELSHADSPHNARVASNKHKRAWRCDMHAVLGGPDGAWVALNGRPNGAYRQVLLMYVGPDLGRLFNNGVSF